MMQFTGKRMQYTLTAHLCFRYHQRKHHAALLIDVDVVLLQKGPRLVNVLDVSCTGRHNSALPSSDYGSLAPCP